MTIFIVMKYTSDYEYSNTEPVKGYVERKDAEDYADKMNKIVERIRKFDDLRTNFRTKWHKENPRVPYHSSSHDTTDLTRILRKKTKGEASTKDLNRLSEIRNAQLEWYDSANAQNEKYVSDERDFIMGVDFLLEEEKQMLISHTAPDKSADFEVVEMEIE